MQTRKINSIPLVLEIDHHGSCSSISTVGMDGCPGEKMCTRTPSELDASNHSATRQRRRRMSAVFSDELEGPNLNGRIRQRRSSWVASAPGRTVTFEETQLVQSTNQVSQRVAQDTIEGSSEADDQEEMNVESDDVSLSFDDLPALSSTCRSSSREYESKISLLGKDELRKLFIPSKSSSSFELSASQRLVFETEEEHKKIKARVQRHELQDLVMSAIKLHSSGDVR